MKETRHNLEFLHRELQLDQVVEEHEFSWIGDNKAKGSLVGKIFIGFLVVSN